MAPSDADFLRAVSDKLYVDHISWRQLAKDSHVAERTLQNWRDGRTHIRLIQALQIARTLHLSIDAATGLSPASPDADTSEIVRLLRFMSQPAREGVRIMLERIAAPGDPTT